LVNDLRLPRHSDFKREFERDGAGASPIVAAIGLTQTDTMLITAGDQRQDKQRGRRVRPFVSLILVSKRTAGGS
jgi:hypothetical protein